MTGILPRRQNAMRIPEQASPKQPSSLPRMGEPASGSVNSRTIYTSTGATEDQMSMVGIVPERINKHGTKIEDLAGSVQHDSLGG